jgi:fibronectin type 3 domain-containing protein
MQSAPVDSNPPTVTVTAPADGSTVSGTTSVTANATDDIGVVGVQFKVDGNPLGAEDTAAPYSVSWDTTTLLNGTHVVTAVARDAGDNTTTSTPVTVTTNNLSPGLVAAYSFDAGQGTTLTDVSGHGNTGTLTSATWTAAGKYGAALSFNGTNSWVTIPDSASLDLTSGMTLEAWINPAALGSTWRTVLFKEQSGKTTYDLYANNGGGRPEAGVWIGAERTVQGSALTANTWSHLAATFDGASIKVYVNGALAGSVAQTGSMAASTGALRIGGNSIYPEWFSGLIDEVRVYNRALPQSEIQTDMNRAVGVADTQAPTAPSNLAASGLVSSVSLSWTGSSDNVGVARYNLHRSSTPGFTPTPANRIGQPTGTTYTDSGLAAGTYYYKVTAEDGAGNVSGPSNEAAGTVTGDVTPPTAPTNLTATPGPGQTTLNWTASTDNVGVARYDVYRSATSGFTPGAGTKIGQSTTPGYSDTGLTPGTYYYRVIAVDGSSNGSTPSNEASAVVTNAPPTGLVAAYGFDEGLGMSLTDLSGNANAGTLAGPTWAAGKYGSALNFDGVNDWVSIADANSLDLTTGMTLEAWVRPAALGTSWRTALFKEQPGNLVYGLYANRETGAPNAQAFVSGSAREADGAALPLNTWTHLAATYDGAALKLWINGTQSASLALSGNISTSTGALRIGGNNVWPEWFSGLIDEVRIYNRALSQTELQADMNRPVGSPDTQAPTAPSNLSASGAISSVALSWTGSTDNVGVARYDVYRSTTSGFTPSTSNRVAQPTGITYNDAGLGAGVYYYRVAAEDAAGNVSATSSEATATVTGDVTPPTAPTGLTATAGPGQASLTWTASTDNVGVVRYDVYRSTVSGFIPSVANRIAQPNGTSYIDAGLASGTYFYVVAAEDGPGNLSAPSNQATATVTTAPPAGLVASYGFDEGIGTVLGDSSGNANNGSIAGATWSATGKFGSALSFNGTNNLVSIADSNSLDLTTGMTLEAWVRPAALGTVWRTVLMKEQSGNLIYDLYGNTDKGFPETAVWIAGERAARATAGLALNTWAHLASTYDGSTLRLYVNGTQTASLPLSGTVATSAGALRIGGNNVWPEWFSGLIDEVRIYNRALSASEVATDMNRPVTITALLGLSLLRPAASPPGLG